MTGSFLPFLLTLLATTGSPEENCRTRDFALLGRNPSHAELRCRFGIEGPGRFGLLSYIDVPVYQPATPMPGTHIVGVPGHARPHIGESYEQWEWRVLRTEFGSEAQIIHRDLEKLDPRLAGRIMEFERRLEEEGVRVVRRETWRSPLRQAYLFQQGRSRPGPLATATLTSWHAQVDLNGQPAGRAVDYDLPYAELPRFHALAEEVGLQSFGADSHDPWHVFLPEEQDATREEIVLLRTIPRVPEVTLATGLPVDRALPAGGLEAVRDASASFAFEPFTKIPLARVATLGVSPDLRKVSGPLEGSVVAGL